MAITSALSISVGHPCAFADEPWLNRFARESLLQSRLRFFTPARWRPSSQIGAASDTSSKAQANSTPIIFLHGVGSDKSVWRPQLDHFGATRRALAFDYPGYGESDLIEGATRDDYAAAILAAMDSLDVERAHVCGLSLGGVVAIAMHAAAPDRCASLIIADSFAVHPRRAGDLRPLDRRKPRHARAGRGSCRCAAGVRGSADARRRSSTRWPASIRPHTASAPKPSGSPTSAIVPLPSDVPTLIIVGDEDAITPPALVRRTRTRRSPDRN